jgi:hypothetical protein
VVWVVDDAWHLEETIPRRPDLVGLGRVALGRGLSEEMHREEFGDVVSGLEADEWIDV